MIKTISLKKKIIGLLLSVSLGIMISSTINAAPYNFETDGGASAMKDNLGYNDVKTPEAYIGQLLLLVFSFVGLVFFILIIYAGIQWMTAQGNSSQVEKAKDAIIKAIVGLVIVMASYGITFFIMRAVSSSATEKNNSFIDTPMNSDPNPFTEPQA